MSGTDTRAPGAEAVADLLVEAGVRRAHTAPGESLLPLIQALSADPGSTVVLGESMAALRRAG